MEKEDPIICGACKKPLKKGEAYYPVATPDRKINYVHEHCLLNGSPRVADKCDAPMVK